MRAFVEQLYHTTVSYKCIIQLYETSVLYEQFCGGGIDKPGDFVHRRPEPVNGVVNFIGFAGKDLFEDLCLLLAGDQHNQLRGGTEDRMGERDSCDGLVGHFLVEQIDDAGDVFGIEAGIRVGE